ncbi:jeltraxin-like [Hyla sarda]|uniref:jeltraxin-like n=1 Tax=Hyla sarda TaxID=327740 RepID=UPI0024C3412B|nr:jeltraxin-like [Hyla sarda]
MYPNSLTQTLRYSVANRGLDFQFTLKKITATSDNRYNSQSLPTVHPKFSSPTHLPFQPFISPLSLHCLPIQFRIQYKLNSKHKTPHNAAPDYIFSLISVNHPTSSLECNDPNQQTQFSDKTIILFSKQTSTDFVTLQSPDKALRQITWFSTNSSRSHHPRESAPTFLSLLHTCVTWDSVTGLLQLWINGKRYPRRITTSRSPIGPQMSIILGQDQDSFGGGFQASQSFLGEICDVNMWDYVLPPEVIKAYFDDYYNITGNIYSWVTGAYKVHGNIVSLTNQFYDRKPQRQCKAI